jgi:hypothetical protein
MLFGTLIDPPTDLLLLYAYYLYFLLFFQQSAHEKVCFFSMNFCAFWKTFINLTYCILSFPPTEYKEKQGQVHEGKVMNIGLFIL